MTCNISFSLFSPVSIDLRAKMCNKYTETTVANKFLPIEPLCFPPFHPQKSHCAISTTRTYEGAFPHTFSSNVTIVKRSCSCATVSKTEREPHNSNRLAKHPERMPLRAPILTILTRDRSAPVWCKLQNTHRTHVCSCLNHFASCSVEGMRRVDYIMDSGALINDITFRSQGQLRVACVWLL